MEKGQIGFDLLLALAVFLAFIQIIQIVQADHILVQEETSLKEQSITVAHQIQSFLAVNSSFFKTVGNPEFNYYGYYLQFEPADIYVFGKKDAAKCTITIESEKISIFFPQNQTTLNKDLTVEVPVDLSMNQLQFLQGYDGSGIFTSECGKQLIIEKTHVV